MEDILSVFESYVVLVILGICLCVGYVLNRMFKTKRLKNFIPLIMAVLGVFLNVWLNKWNVSPDIVLGGMVSGLSSTGLHHAFSQSREVKNSEKNVE